MSHTRSDNRSDHRTVVSKDGTSISYRCRGTGPALVLVGGGLDDGTENDPLMDRLAGDFTVHNYARRGRGGSGNVLPYAVAREVEDLAAVLDVAGEPAHVFGPSSGGALALRAATELPIKKVAVYEVPYQVDEESVRTWRAYVRDLTASLADGRRDHALELFMRLAGSTDEEIGAARASEYWAPLVELAPTLAHDAACLGDGPPPPDLLRRVGQPTLVATGGTPDPLMSGLAPGFFDDAADAIDDALPQSERRVVADQGHVADPDVLGDVLREFFRR